MQSSCHTANSSNQTIVIHKSPFGRASVEFSPTMQPRSANTGATLSTTVPAETYRQNSAENARAFLSYKTEEAAQRQYRDFITQSRGLDGGSMPFTNQVRNESSIGVTGRNTAQHNTLPFSLSPSFVPSDQKLLTQEEKDAEEQESVRDVMCCFTLLLIVLTVW
ncbi:hypothetical protein HELRODRAFT_167186 [Helobdella robusta]|uniref:Uncharacterized protein n=1 Tax=Helobdella robusta TaxID=6412 RepID=T1EZ41_HELRO|nr:hypothetical protein HELRODRAFT_167186 [Helobdella robusta]ESO10694.1 hypothetical protein HELRODRAFT_167186 [Helobdella robusta]